jgi:type IV fimbrial biogenesis protein FimT
MNTMHTHRKPTAGFTLVELLVVIAIVAIMLALAVPSYKSVTVQDRMASEIGDFTTDVELARSAAVKQGMPVTICASANPAAAAPACNGTDWSTGWIVFTDVASPPNQAYAAASGDTLLRIHAALQGGDTLAGSSGAIGAYGGTLNVLEFNRMGGTQITGGATQFDVFSLHDKANTVVWRRCLLVAGVGTGQLSTQYQNPGDDCP